MYQALHSLERPFVKYVANDPGAVRKHFHGILEAYPNTRGFALFDRLDLHDNEQHENLIMTTWAMREIENYLCQRETLFAYAEQSTVNDLTVAGPLFSQVEVQRRVEAMSESIDEITNALRALNRGSPWDGNLKVSDDFLDPVFRSYFSKIGMPNIMQKTNYHVLVRYVPIDGIDSEIVDKLLGIASTAGVAGDVP